MGSQLMTNNFRGVSHLRVLPMSIIVQTHRSAAPCPKRITVNSLVLRFFLPKAERGGKVYIMPPMMTGH